MSPVLRAPSHNSRTLSLIGSVDLTLNSFCFLFRSKFTRVGLKRICQFAAGQIEAPGRLFGPAQSASTASINTTVESVQLVALQDRYGFFLPRQCVLPFAGSSYVGVYSAMSALTQ